MAALKQFFKQATQSLRQFHWPTALPFGGRQWVWHLAFAGRPFPVTGLCTPATTLSAFSSNAGDPSERITEKILRQVRVGPPAHPVAVP